MNVWHRKNDENRFFSWLFFLRTTSFNYSCDPVERNWGDGQIITLEREFVVSIYATIIIDSAFWMSFVMGWISTNTMLFSFQLNCIYQLMSLLLLLLLFLTDNVYLRVLDATELGDFLSFISYQLGDPRNKGWTFSFINFSLHMFHCSVPVSQSSQVNVFRTLSVSTFIP